MKYTKQNIQKKRQILSSEKIRRNSKISLFLFKYAFIISIALIVTGLGLGVGFVRGILKTTPQITKDSVHSKGYITTIYDNKGSTIKTLSNHDSNRIYTPLSSVPKNLQHHNISPLSFSHSIAHSAAYRKAFSSQKVTNRYDCPGCF